MNLPAGTKVVYQAESMDVPLTATVVSRCPGLGLAYNLDNGRVLVPNVHWFEIVAPPQPQREETRPMPETDAPATPAVHKPVQPVQAVQAVQAVQPPPPPPILHRVGQCADCGLEFPKRTGNMKRCPACQEDKKRRDDRAKKRAKYGHEAAGEPVVCQDCGQTFAARNRKQCRCPACQHQHTLNNRRRFFQSRRGEDGTPAASRPAPKPARLTRAMTDVTAAFAPVLETRVNPLRLPTLTVTDLVAALDDHGLFSIKFALDGKTVTVSVADVPCVA
jgi:predicted Zn-ribbon and HTH transcriptional regulator